MADTTLAVKDATGATQALAETVGPAGLEAYHIEDTAQRATLIAALAALGSHTDDQAILAALAPSVAYTEKTVTVAAGSWTLLSAANPSRRKLVLGDATGLSALWARTDAAPTTAGEGIPFSGASSPGSWVFDTPVPTGAIYGKCATAGVLTVVEA